MSLGDKTYKELVKIAEKKEITIQELIRAVIIPEYLAEKRIA